MQAADDDDNDIQVDIDHYIQHLSALNRSPPQLSVSHPPPLPFSPHHQHCCQQHQHQPQRQQQPQQLQRQQQSQRQQQQQHLRSKKIDVQAAAEIRRVACELCEEHRKKARTNAKRRIRSTIRMLVKANQNDLRESLAYDKSRDVAHQRLLQIQPLTSTSMLCHGPSRSARVVSNDIGNDISNGAIMNQSSNGNGMLSVSSLSSSSLSSCAASSSKPISSTDGDGQELIVQMPIVSKPHAYLSWAPSTGYHVTDLEEPYLVYSGDSDMDRMKSEKLYASMFSQYRKLSQQTLGPVAPPCSYVEYMSDGEIDAEGNFKMISQLARQRNFNHSQKLETIRLREAQRHAILHIVNQHGISRQVFIILSEALQLRHERRAFYFYQVARFRHEQIEMRRQRIIKARIENKQILSVLKQSRKRVSVDEYARGVCDRNGDIGDAETDDVEEDDVNMDMPEHWSDRKKLSKAVHFPNAIRHFCRLCMIFGCAVHGMTQVTPRKPIPDPKRDERVLKVKRRKIPPCSPLCFMRLKSSDTNTDAVVANTSIGGSTTPSRRERREKEWSTREITLLREAVSIFEQDPCSLAVVVGSRSCREVHAKMNEPEQRKWIDAIVEMARAPAMEPLNGGPAGRRKQSGRKKITAANGKGNGHGCGMGGKQKDKSRQRDEENASAKLFFDGSDVDDDLFGYFSSDGGTGSDSGAIRYRSKARKSATPVSRGRKSTRPWGERVHSNETAKGDANESTSGARQEVVEVKNDGTANTANATSKKGAKKRGVKELEEEKMNLPDHEPCDHDGPCSEEKGCWCVSNLHYCETSCRCHAARYVVEPNGQINVVGNECLQTKEFCNCVNGRCDTDDCICRRNNQACTPGGCGCDSYLLPSQVRPRDRKCVNCDFIVGRHKRTFIGNSSIDGLGLFAGEDFQTGDLVGVYWGLRWNEDLIDLATMLGEHRKRTYSFDLTNDTTVDATIVGGKMRFANHGKNAESRNCQSEIFYVNGKAHICIYTTRDVRVGQEFLFDYKLTTPVGNNWMNNVK